MSSTAYLTPTTFLRRFRALPSITRRPVYLSHRAYACTPSPSPPPAPRSSQPSQPPQQQLQQPATAAPEQSPEELLEQFEASFVPPDLSLITNADLSITPTPNTCRGCGASLQTDTPLRPGFVPQEVLSTIKETSLLPDVETKDPICQRCYRLTHYGAIDQGLRISKDGELPASKFRKILQRLSGLNAVVVYLVDIFDFHGSFIPALRDIVGGKNPIVVGVNKVDLLPDNYKASRVESWIRAECSSMGLRDIASVHLISSTRGSGVPALVAEAFRIAKRRRGDIYVVGAANVGKSSFINQLRRIRKRERERSRNGKVDEGKKEIGLTSRNGKVDEGKKEIGLTTSVVPGTTLDVIRIPLGSGVNLFDTPGLMMPHQLTNYLDTKDLRAVLPAKNVQQVTLRLGEGKALFIGSMARLEVVSGRPFFFTTFFSPQVKIHPGKLENADEFVDKHAGGMLTPPFEREHFERLGEWTSKSFTAKGEGWKRSCMDVVFSGLGWIGITGVGEIRLRVCVPGEVGVFTREPLMPFEIQSGASTYTGSAAVNRRQMKRSSQKRRKASNE